MHMLLVLQDSDVEGSVRNAPPLTRGHKESGTRKLRSGAILPNAGVPWLALSAFGHFI